MENVVILGAKGRFGRAATRAFQEQGWRVRVFGRGLVASEFPGAECVNGDAQDAGAVRQACAGMDVIVHTLNPPYPDWTEALPGLTANVIAAAQASGAHVLIPGNVYNYGAGKPARLNERTPWRPTTRKGRLRVEMEEAFRASGVPTLVLRAGDFFEPANSGDWFGQYITAHSAQGKTLYPGPLDQVHAWAYLPDMARAAALLAAKRDEFGAFEEFSFGGYGVTGQEMIDAIGAALERPQQHKKMPWTLVRLMGLFNPLMREVCEMRYLWRVPHQLDGSKLAAVLPGFEPTPFAVAVRAALVRLGARPTA